VVEHAVKAQLADLRAAQEARKARLTAASEKERKLRAVNGYGAFRGPGVVKRPKVDVHVGRQRGEKKDDDGDEEFLPDDKLEKGEGDGMYLSAEVKELMARYSLPV
jgi:hypothetical protein